jgi:hypothetical protein
MRQTWCGRTPGAPNEEIAQELIFTKNTVRVHRRRILEKLDLRNRQQIAAYAVREGFARTTGTLNTSPNLYDGPWTKPKVILVHEICES